MNIKKIFLVVVLPVLMLFQTTAFSYAEQETVENLEALAVVLVIDTSGSMEATDPQNLRGTAANIFIDLLSPEDYLSVITFNSYVDVVLPMEKVKTIENKKSIKEKLAPNLLSSGDTNYNLALSESKQQLSKISDENVRKVIIFLTDGTPDPYPKMAGNAVFMNEYMKSLWDTVSLLSLNKYPVYSVGFSEGVNPYILQRISMETQGEYKVFNDSAKLASSFFQILSNLKNRNNFLNTELNVDGEKKLDFEFDKFTSQVTLVFTNSDRDTMDISLVPPNGKAPGSNLLMNRTKKYTIITLNQKNEELVGNWLVDIKGNGAVKTFGAKDLFVKSWFKKPISNSVHPVNMPIEIAVAITGSDSSELRVEATIKKDGIKEIMPVTLNYEDGLYTGIYEKTSSTGTYEIEVKVFQGVKSITSSSETVVVKVMPTLDTEDNLENKSFISGSNTIVTSSLNMNGNPMIASTDLYIDKYQILINTGSGKGGTITLYDNGSSNNGDMLSNDGIYSTKIKYDHNGHAKAILIAKGTYNGESFLLEESLGNFWVYPPGKVDISINHGGLYGRSGEIIEIPFKIKNTSSLPEVINLSADKSYGTFPVSQIVVAPKSDMENMISFQLNKNMKDGIINVPVNIEAEQKLTKIKDNQIIMEIQVVSGIYWLAKRVLERIFVLIVLVSVPMAVILIGYVLYRILVFQNRILRGKLLYYKTNDIDKKTYELNLKSLKKSKVVISFNDENTNADYRIANSGCIYNIELSNIIENVKCKFIEGYKALASHQNNLKILLSTTEPGIFMHNGMVYTKTELSHENIFETGGYTFQYLEDDKKKVNTNASNILEGKI